MNELFDSFYGDALLPFLQKDLFEIQCENLEEDYFRMDIREVETVTLFFNKVYYKVPYHPEFTVDTYCRFFALLYALDLAEDIQDIDQHKTFINDAYEAIICATFRLNDEISYGSMLELTQEPGELFPDEYCFNVLNATG
jgi:hypothetical protein